MSTVAGPARARSGWNRSWRARPLLQWAAALLIGGIWIGAGFRSRTAADFANFYCAGEILRERDAAAVYQSGPMAECYERRFPAQEPVLPFIRPPFYALALAPLTAFGPEAAMWAWMVLNIAALAAAALLTAQATGIESSAVALLAALFFPSLYAFFNRQDAPLVAALAAAGYALAARGRDRAAGLALAAAAIKFHLLVMMPVALLGRSRKPEARSQKRRVLEGFLVGVGLLVAISLVMVGPAGLLEYGRMLALRSAPNIEINPQRIANLSSLGGGSWIQVPLIALAAGAVLVAARRLPTPEAMAAAWLTAAMLFVASLAQVP